MMVDKRKFKDINVSLLSLGTMRLPCETEQKRESNPNIDYDKAQSLVDLAYKNGARARSEDMSYGPNTRPNLYEKSAPRHKA